VDDCQDCGVCCFSETDRRVRVTPEDLVRLGADAERFVIHLDGITYMRVERTGLVGRCAALGISPSGRFSCEVYARRPEICRAFVRGSHSCLAERAIKGGRPRRLLEVLPAGGVRQ
jgi:Fe-S-cluster containining protein